MAEADPVHPEIVEMDGDRYDLVPVAAILEMEPVSEARRALFEIRHAPLGGLSGGSDGGGFDRRRA